MVESLHGSRILVVGLGRSGLAAARLAASRGAQVRVTDRRPEADLGSTLDLLPSGVERFLGGHPPALLEDVDVVVSSPGVPPGAEILQAARARGIAVWPEVELAWRQVPERTLVAVTGSNGKSTVTTLVAEMLRAAGVAAVAGGNLGTAASDLVLDEGWECWVLEVSSFQAEMLARLRPDVGVFLNLSQDHLERHPDMASYRDAKRRLFSLQGPRDLAVLNADDPVVADTPTAARRRFFSLERPADGWLEGDRLVLDGEPLIERDRLALGGLHNVANALASAIAAVDLGVRRQALAATLERFAPLTHRHVTVHEAGGVRWVDDSKATNVGAVVAALRGYPQGSVHLILGGQGKGQDFTVLADEVRRAAARVYLIGRDASLIAAALEGTAPMERCGTLAEAVHRARGQARPGQWVVLAPACASFDQFSGFAERGEAFAALARAEGVGCP
jgi:UDP-N-acetylmuramoylalanine--D-glutamate ligase